MTVLADPTAPPIALPDAAPATNPFTAIDSFDALRSLEGDWGAHLRRARELAAAFRTEFATTGQPDYAKTFDLVGVPYPTKFGLWRAAMSPAPFLTITNRMMVLRWTDTDGRKRTALFEPSDVDLDENTPYFAALRAKGADFLRPVIAPRHGDVLTHLSSIGVDPTDVDYIFFDHLHTQDVRHWIGTTKPQADISPSSPVRAAFPNARLVVQRAELEAMRDLHPLQRPWYQPETYIDLPAEKLLVIDGSFLLGPGVALIYTPGHAAGNQTLALNTSTGIWATSENAIAAECMTPEHSKIPGVAKWARTWGQEVILNANTIENTAQQYNSMVIEKTIPDRAQSDGRFLQFFPSSELTGRWTAPGLSPTFVHGGIAHGRLI